ncbi:MAG: hypothetical protein WEK74_03565, partial [Hydrogenophaga sp.]
MSLPDGLYDLLLTEGLTRSLAELEELGVNILTLKGGASEALADVVARQLTEILDGMGGDGVEKARLQLELVNGVLLMLRQRLKGG